ncbi:MAG: phosphatase PAP2 family protein [Bacteroidia bacterium]
MGLQLAKIISYLFHPIFMPFIGSLIILHSNNYFSYSLPSEFKNIVLGLIFLNTALVPALISYYMLKKGWISSLQMHQTHERRIPYLLTAVFYMITYFILQKAPLPPMLMLMILGASLAVVICLVINLVWKISAHMVGIGGLLGAIMGISIRFKTDMLIFIMFLIFISGLVASSRLRLNAHNPLQVFIGFLIGFLSEFLLIYGV